MGSFIVDDLPPDYSSDDDSILPSLLPRDDDNSSCSSPYIHDVAPKHSDLISTTATVFASAPIGASNHYPPTPAITLPALLPRNTPHPLPIFPVTPLYSLFQPAPDDDAQRRHDESALLPPDNRFHGDTPVIPKPLRTTRVSLFLGHPFEKENKFAT
jgi:hypothetical protein